jgi:hypothetical protein
MSGYVLVVPTPYYAKSDKDGKYTIDNVPDGQHTIVAWREGVKSQSKTVSVAGDSKADFSLIK